MGLFDEIKKTVNKVSSEYEEIVERALEWDTYKICRYIKDTTSVTKRTAYVKALKIRCSEMDDYELKRTFDDVYYDRNAYAMKAMSSEMIDRGLAYKDDNGNFHKNY